MVPTISGLSEPDGSRGSARSAMTPKLRPGRTARRAGPGKARRPRKSGPGAASAPRSSVFSMTMQSSAAYDLVIRGGTIVDGLGGAPYVGDVAMRNGLIAAVGAV